MNERGYYETALAGERLRRVYELAPPRVRQYLDAEVEYVAARIRPGDVVLDLGCGYGRAGRRWAEKARLVVGVDTSPASLALGRQELAAVPNLRWVATDAARLGVKNAAVDVVACIQNGVSAFHVDADALVAEAARVTKRGGVLLFSSYAQGFWENRLDWFERQAAAGLIGEIDYARTGGGAIVCKDGFAATTTDAAAFAALAARAGLEALVTEVDGSSLFCELRI